MFDLMQKWLNLDFKSDTVYFLVAEHDAIIHLTLRYMSSNCKIFEEYLSGSSVF